MSNHKVNNSPTSIIIKAETVISSSTIHNTTNGSPASACSNTRSVSDSDGASPNNMVSPQEGNGTNETKNNSEEKGRNNTEPPTAKRQRVHAPSAHKIPELNHCAYMIVGETSNLQEMIVNVVKSKVNPYNSVCSYDWSVEDPHQQSTYKVHASGKFQLDYKTLVGSGLAVDCTCPEGPQLAKQSQERQLIMVCEHAGAALRSVEDTNMSLTSITSKRLKAHGLEVWEASLLPPPQIHVEKDKDMRKVQNRLFPGERDRIELGIKALGATKVHEHLLEACQSVEGLQILGSLFPLSVLPQPQLQHCVRCNKDYDLQYSEQRTCRMPHPDHLVSWMGGSQWKRCYRCDSMFGNVPSYVGHDAGECCFEGPHTQDECQVKEEMWNADINEFSI